MTLETLSFWLTAIAILAMILTLMGIPIWLLGKLIEVLDTDSKRTPVRETDSKCAVCGENATRRDCCAEVCDYCTYLP